MRKWKVVVPYVVICAMLAMPTVSSALSKTLSMTMKDKSKTISCVCPSALVQGGAMIGGKGINYSIISITDEKGTLEMKSGSCASGVSFKKYEYYSPSGWSGTLKLTESQRSTTSPGIGWGRIDY